MYARIAQILAAALLAGGLVASLPATAQSLGGDGIVRVKSAYPLDETVARLKQDIAAKRIGSSRKSTSASSPPRPGSGCCRRRCSCSATRRSARSS
jgi:hypothetical protein